MDWLTDNKIPVGKWIEAAVDFFYAHFAWFFDGITYTFEFLIEGTADALGLLHPLVLIGLIAGLAYLLQRSWKLLVFLVPGLLLIVNLGYWEDTILTISLVTWATTLSMVIGVPIGIAAAHRPRFWLFMRPVLDMMQTIPTFVYLIPALIFFGLGVVAGMVATIIFALPAPIRLTYLGISSAPKPLLEAAESFGATKRQLLWMVEVPHAMPTIMAGLTQCIMLSLSMVVIAAMVGADGLGIPVLRAINTVNVAKGFEAGLAIVIVAILMDRICKRPGAGPGGE
ncbi:choline ABC transporter permease subunit [Hwanghaeella grinnelliae]|uniref:Choline ABC transporter permease subunit n=1 Tax=Hwanghaeella grinnelliae TaxID=2500179 RepID=A0A437QH02_9PROT|nr:choline ABC transporter permease subunit [Hwanghaeella grinnelliae]RVU33835.1 choline ABC transporter permease subunit [Hwanghaeella grinnelliae]